MYTELHFTAYESMYASFVTPDTEILSRSDHCQENSAKKLGGGQPLDLSGVLADKFSRQLLSNYPQYLAMNYRDSYQTSHR